jgi:hypothetical protein
VGRAPAGLHPVSSTEGGRGGAPPRVKDPSGERVPGAGVSPGNEGSNPSRCVCSGGGTVNALGCSPQFPTSSEPNRNHWKTLSRPAGRAARVPSFEGIERPWPFGRARHLAAPGQLRPAGPPDLHRPRLRRPALGWSGRPGAPRTAPRGAPGSRNRRRPFARSVGHPLSAPAGGAETRETHVQHLPHRPPRARRAAPARPPPALPGARSASGVRLRLRGPPLRRPRAGGGRRAGSAGRRPGRGARRGDRRGPRAGRPAPGRSAAGAPPAGDPPLLDRGPARRAQGVRPRRAGALADGRAPGAPRPTGAGGGHHRRARARAPLPEGAPRASPRAGPVRLLDHHRCAGERPARGSASEAAGHPGSGAPDAGQGDPAPQPDPWTGRRRTRRPSRT